MKYLIYFLSILIIFGLNIGIFKNFPLVGQIPNLLFLFALSFSVEKKDYDFFFVSLISGLLMDFYSPSFFGGFTLAFLVCGLAMHLFSNSVLVLEFNWKTLIPALGIGLLLFNLIVWLYGFSAFRFHVTLEYTGIEVFAKNFIPTLLYTAVFLYPTYAFANFLKRSIERINIRSRGVIR